MKNINLSRRAAQAQSVFTDDSRNVQEIERVNAVTIADKALAVEQSRQRILTQRTARNARRLAH